MPGRHDRHARRVEAAPLTSRRKFLRYGAAGLLVPAAVHAGIITQSGPRSPGVAGGGGSFDYYIGPSGSDSNDGLTTSTPWAITALNTKRATYAGHSVGLLDGTYSTTGMSPYDGGFTPKLGIAGGSSGSQTVIQAVNARQAVIDGGADAAYAAIGSFDSDTAYITIKNLVVQNCTASSIHIQRTGGSQAPGIRVEGCDIGDQEYDVADITSGIFLQSCDDAVVTNNHIHDVVNTVQALSESGIELYGCRRTEITENTFSNLNTAIYDKYAGGVSGSRIDMQETRVRRNYFLEIPIALLGFDNKDQTATPPNDPPYGAYIIENNVFEGCGNMLTNPGAFCASAPVIVRNNTIYNASGAISGFNLHTRVASDSYRPSYYNNIAYNGGSWTEWLTAIISLDSGTPQLITFDYNLYGPTQLRCQTYSVVGYPYSGGGSFNTVTSLASWQTTTGQEAGSIVDDPEFLMTGTGADRFKLNSATSPCWNAGRVGGVSGGDTRHMGAWDGVVTQIGKDW